MKTRVFVIMMLVMSVCLAGCGQMVEEAIDFWGEQIGIVESTSDAQVIEEPTVEQKRELTEEEQYLKLMEEEKDAFLHSKAADEYEYARKIMQQECEKYMFTKCLGYVLDENCIMKDCEAYARYIVFGYNDAEDVEVYDCANGHFMEEPEWVTTLEFQQFAELSDGTVLLQGMEDELTEIKQLWEQCTHSNTSTREYITDVHFLDGHTMEGLVSDIVCDDCGAYIYMGEPQYNW